MLVKKSAVKKKSREKKKGGGGFDRAKVLYVWTYAIWDIITLWLFKLCHDIIFKVPSLQQVSKDACYGTPKAQIVGLSWSTIIFNGSYIR